MFKRHSVKIEKILVLEGRDADKPLPIAYFEDEEDYVAMMLLFNAMELILNR